MTAFTLIDTSSWTHALRRAGDPTITARVRSLLANGRAAWCDAVRLELWKGVRDDRERAQLSEMGRSLPSLPITDAVWNLACDTGGRARKNGFNFPAVDLIIFACAKFHAVEIEHSDKHFLLLEQMV